MKLYGEDGRETTAATTMAAAFPGPDGWPELASLEAAGYQRVLLRPGHAIYLAPDGYGRGAFVKVTRRGGGLEFDGLEGERMRALDLDQVFSGNWPPYRPTPRKKYRPLPL